MFSQKSWYYPIGKSSSQNRAKRFTLDHHGQQLHNGKHEKGVKIILKRTSQ
jgi:hypothetical protein